MDGGENEPGNITAETAVARIEIAWKRCLNSRDRRAETAAVQLQKNFRGWVLRVQWHQIISAHKTEPQAHLTAENEPASEGRRAKQASKAGSLIENGSLISAGPQQTLSDYVNVSLARGVRLNQRRDGWRPPGYRGERGSNPFGSLDGGSKISRGSTVSNRS
jgi:hypothetical protein